MSTHILKIWIEYYKKVEDGTKTFELRKNDRGFKVGDRLILQEYNLKSKSITGNEIVKTISHIVEDVKDFGLMDGYCILSLHD